MDPWKQLVVRAYDRKIEATRDILTERPSWLVPSLRAKVEAENMDRYRSALARLKLSVLLLKLNSKSKSSAQWASSLLTGPQEPA